MARRRKGRAVHGVLLLNKPVGLSSNQALTKVRWLFSAQKAGHGGTLDPFAEGLLPILFGEAAKFGQFLLDADKAYQVTLKLGEQTDTDDMTGTVICTAPVPHLSAQDWQNVLRIFIGGQMQQPPIYSALKVNGARAYELARKGQFPELDARHITIHELTLLNYTDTEATLFVRCSKGTYIRSLVRDLGRALGTVAHATALKRVAVSSFTLAQSIALDDLSLRKDEGYSALDDYLLPLTTCVSPLPKLILPEEKVRYLRHGNDVALVENVDCDVLHALYDGEQFLGVGRVKQGRVYPERLLSLSME